MTIKIKKLHPDATFKKAHESDIGYDLTACGYEYKENGLWHIKLGIAVMPSNGTYFEIVPRSSFSKTPFILPNSIGIIDPDYRGELRFPVRHLAIAIWHESNSDQAYPKVSVNNSHISLELAKKWIEEDIQTCLIGKRIAQAIPRLIVNGGDIKYVDELPKTERGDGGFGSTGE